MVARSVSPSESKGQWHLHLPLPPAPGHVATEACAASVLAGPAGAGVGLGQDPRPGRHLGLLRRDWACGAWEEGTAEANVTLGGGGGSLLPLCLLRGSPALMVRDKFSLPTLGQGALVKYENSWRCPIKPPSLPPGLGPVGRRGMQSLGAAPGIPQPCCLLPRSRSRSQARGRDGLPPAPGPGLEHRGVAQQFLFESDGWSSTHVGPGAGWRPSNHVGLTYFWKEMADQSPRAARLQTFAGRGSRPS